MKRWRAPIPRYRSARCENRSDDREGWGPPSKSERRTRLRVVAEEGTVFHYVYDFGDNWDTSWPRSFTEFTICVRSDAAGATHDFAAHCRERGVAFSLTG